MNNLGSSNALVTFGETMGLFTAAKVGRFGLDRAFTFGIGGAESNVAIGAARLGTPVTWFGRLGNDSIGRHIARLLEYERIETIAIQDPGFTGVMVKHEPFAGSVGIDYHRAGSAASRLCPDDIPADRIRVARILHITGIIPALSDSARDTAFAAVELAKESGVLVSIDINYRRRLWNADEASAVLRDLVAKSDIVFAGRDESDLVTGSTTDSASHAADELIRVGGTEVVIKDGARGCYAIIDHHRHEVPAISIGLVDPVGAGDAFVAAYLAEKLRGSGPAERLSVATQVGGLAVAVPGDCENLPFRSDLSWIDGDDVAR